MMSLIQFVEKIYWHLFKVMPCEMILKKKWAAYYKFGDINGTFDLSSIRACKANANNGKVIWFYWEQGLDNAPQIVKCCLASVKRYLPKDWQVVVLDMHSAKEYIEMPTFVEEIYNDGKMWKALYADLLRLSLLYKYGGIWSDATCYFMQPLPDGVINEPLFFFKIEAMMPCYPLSYENWFIRATPGNYVIGRILECLLCYWHKEPKKQEYFIWFYIQYSLYNNDQKARAMLDNMWYCNNYDAMLVQIKYGLSSPYSERLWNQISNKCFVQKLTYKYDSSIVYAAGKNLISYILRGGC